LAYALRVPDPAERGVGLAHLARHLEEPARSKALYPVLDVFRFGAAGRHDGWRERLVEELPRGLPEAFLRQLIDAAQGLPESGATAGVLRALASKVPVSLLPALRHAAEPLFEDGQATVLAALVDAFPPPASGDLLDEALKLAGTLNREPLKTETLLRLAGHLAAGKRERILARARELILGRQWGTPQGAELRVLLASKWQGPGLAEIAEEALASTLLLRHGAERLLPRLLPLLPAAARRRVATAARSGDDRWAQISLVTGLAEDAARSGRYREALEHVRAIDPSLSSGRAGALAVVAPHLSPAVLSEALDLAREEWGGQRRVALDALAPLLPEPLLRRAFAASREVGDRTQLLNGRAALAPALARQGRSSEMLDWAAAVHWKGGEGIESMAPFLAPGELGAALVKARTVNDPADRAQALTGIALAMPAETRGKVLEEALAAARKSRRPGEEARRLLRLWPHLEGAAQRQVLRRLLRLLRRLAVDRRASWWFVEALGPEVSHLPEEALREILGHAVRLVGTGHQRSAFELLAPWIPEVLVRQVLLDPERTWSAEHPLKQGLRPTGSSLQVPEIWIARVLRDHGWQARMLAEEASLLPEGTKRESLVREAVSRIREIASPEARAEALTRLASFSGDRDILQAGLAVCLAIPDPLRRADALAAYAPILEPLRRERVLLACRALRGEPQGPPSRERALHELSTAGSAETLLALVRGLDEPEKERALAAAMEAADGIAARDVRLWAILPLVPHLPLQEAERVLLEDVASAASFLRLPAYVEVLRSRAAELTTPFWQALLKALARERSSWLQIQLLPEILPLLPLALVPEVLSRMPDDPEGERLLSILQALAPRLAELPLAELHALWGPMLRRLAGGTRGGLAVDLGALAPVAARLGGREALETAFDALDWVGRWWR
jgi:hypothetical protein